MTTINPAWLQRPEVKQLLSLLNGDGATTRCVGGCVRDNLLGVDSPETEVDMATTLTPEQVQARLDSANIKHKPIGIEHGTIMAFIEGQKIEITTLRRDVATDGRHAKVELISDWAEDAARRDFTINALYIDADGTLHDPTGQGLDDIKKKSVRFIGNAEDRIAEDYLRILRFVRFFWKIEEFKQPHNTIRMKEAEEACKNASQKLTSLSAERKRDEFLKILELNKCSSAVQDLQNMGALTYIIGLMNIEVNLSRLDEFMTDYYRTAENNFNIYLRLASLMPDAERAEKTAEALRLSNKDKKHLIALLGDVNLKNIEAELYWHGKNIVFDRVLLKSYKKEKDGSGQIDTEDYIDIKNKYENWQKPVFPITGERLKEEGMQAGEEMGEVLKKLEQWWVANGFPAKQKLEDELQKKLRERN